MCVSTALGIGCHETLWLREVCGQDAFAMMLEVRGINPNSPIELEWKCPGLRGIPELGIAPRPCTNNAEYQQPCMIGAKSDKPTTILDGDFCCNKCHCAVATLQAKILEALEQEEYLSEEQHSRMDSLRQQQENKRVHTQARRDRLKSTEEGKEELVFEDRRKDRE
jgi:hypothetical protein